MPKFSDTKVTRFGDIVTLTTLKAAVSKGRFYAKDSKSVELRFMSVRVGLGVPSRLNVSKYFKNVSLF